MKIVVEDANVLLDLLNGDILGLWLGCGYKNLTTHFVWKEIIDTDQQSKIQPFIDSGLIVLEDVPVDVYPAINDFAKTSRVSIADSSVWWLASSSGAILLTGDSRLRLSAKKDGIQVRGVLWVLDELIRLERATRHEASTALSAMLQKGAFLPPEECKARLQKWKR